MNLSVTINGKSSESVRGLLIQSLPPITLPKMRTTIDSIDGRDGDIVTKLGYSAYDKEISIGLYGKYDVNDVITFFNQSGKITFSNEPDKYYNFQMLEQIDFQKLIRFKTATVKFHVQPYKYSTLEGAKVVNNPENSIITVLNKGNFASKPKIGIIGTGTINLSLNGFKILVISLGDTSTSITIDSDEMEAYNSSGLMNRYVSGSYDDLELKPGLNTFSLDGTITQFKIENYSRWL